MAVKNVPNQNCITVTALLITQTPEVQAPAVQFPYGFRAIDVANARVFTVGFGTAGVPVWQVSSPFLIPDMKWGNGTATVAAAVQRIFDPEFTDRAATALAGGITAANFETQAKLIAQYDCRVRGVRFTRSGAGAPGGLTAIQLFNNGVAIGAASALAAGVFSGTTIFAAPVSIAAGDRLQAQALINTATVQNFIIEALVLPPAG